MCYLADVILSRRPRNPALTSLVDSVWVHRGRFAHHLERVVPSGRMQLLVNLHDDVLRDYSLDGREANRAPGAGLQGARTAPVLIDTDGQWAICGVSFAPAGASVFFRSPASDLTDRVVDLAEVWGRDGAVLRERLLEAPDLAAQLDLLETTLLERRREVDQSDRELERACALLAAGESVRSVRDRLGLAPRRLIDRFRARVGLTPKLFARIARLQRALQGIDGEPSWADLAASHGFSDQAHMTREFRVLAGTTPAAYRARSTDERNHCPLEPGKFSSIRGKSGTVELPHEPSRNHT